jgi:cytoskeletal protein RodZ
VVLLGLLLFFPFGLVVLWQRADWSVKRRAWLSAATAMLVIGALAGQHGGGTGSGQSGAAALSAPSTTTSGVAAPATSSATTSSPTTSSPTATSHSAAAAMTRATTQATTRTAVVPTTQAAAIPAPATTAVVVDPTTTEAPVVTTAAATSLCGAPANPYGYNFCGGGDIYTPPSDICSYFTCIDNFWNGTGYMVECADGTYSMSGGHRGVCSYHGGEQRAVYS